MNATNRLIGYGNTKGCAFLFCENRGDCFNQWHRNNLSTQKEDGACVTSISGYLGSIVTAKKLSLKEIDAEIAKLETEQISDLESNEKYENSNRVYYFKPYAWMNRAIELLSKKNIVVMPAPNKIGKCLTYITKVQTLNGEKEVGALYEKGEPFKVWAWDGDKKVIADATAPFKKDGLHKCYRFEMSDGRFIEAADNHRILTDRGYVFAEEIHSSFSQCLPHSTSEPCQSIHALDVRRSMKRVAGYLSNYLGYYRSCDGRLLSGRESSRCVPPLRADAQERIQFASFVGVLGGKYKDSPFLALFRPSSLYVLIHSLAQSFASLVRDSYRLFLLNPCYILEGQRFSTAASFSPRQEISLSSETPCQPLAFSLSSSPLMVDDTTIISSKYIGSKEVYDFTVDKYHNYCAGGMVHHNTALNICLLDSFCRGYEAWNEVAPDYPKAVKDVVNGKTKYFKPSCLGINPPVRIRVSGEDWFKHFGETIIPEMKKWMPLQDYERKRNSMGFEYKWIHKKTQSTIELITYKQDAEASESWLGDAWIPDEPPPKEMFEGMSRGIFLKKGKVFMPTTPLKEAWILDELVLSGRRDVGVIDDLTILANDDLYRGDTDALKELGLNENQIAEFFDLLLFKNKNKRMFSDDQGRSAERFVEDIAPKSKHDLINKLMLLRFVKDTPPELASTRFGGQFKSLVGRVIKNFDKNKHWVEPFDIPTDWPVIAMIDFHLNKPHAVSYHSVSPQGIYFIIKEIYANMTTEELADAIIRDKSANAWNLREAQIDPLSKGDTNYMNNRFGEILDDSFSIIERRLRAHRIRLSVGSKDKTSGINNINAELKGVNGTPTSFIFNTCERHFLELMRWVYDDHAKPTKGNKDDYDDMMENWYRRTLSGLKYKEKPVQSYSAEPVFSGEHAWMGM